MRTYKVKARWGTSTMLMLFDEDLKPEAKEKDFHFIELNDFNIPKMNTIDLELIIYNAENKNTIILHNDLGSKGVVDPNW